MQNDRDMLIVEDHEMTRRAMGRIFERRGWSVRSAATIAEGLEMLDPPPNCIILDLMLPDGDGEEILREVRARGLTSRVAITTGSSDPSRFARLDELRPDAFFQKPVDPSAICFACRPAGDAPSCN